MAERHGLLGGLTRQRKTSAMRRQTVKNILKSHPNARQDVEHEAYALISTAILSIPGGAYDFFSINNPPFHKICETAEIWLRSRIGAPGEIPNADLNPLLPELSPLLFRLAGKSANRIFNEKTKYDFLMRIENRYDRAKHRKDKDELERLVGGLLSIYIDIKPKKNPFLITFIYFQLIRRLERLYHTKFDLPTP